MDYNIVVGAFRDLLISRKKSWLEANHKTYDSDFARWIEFGPTSLSNWINGGNVPKSKATIEKLAAKLGPEVYDALGLIRPGSGDETGLSNLLPQDVLTAILEARSEYSSELSRRGITEDSPEARRIIKLALLKAVDKLSGDIDIKIDL